MTPMEESYRQTATRVGLTMLVFEGFFFLMSGGVILLSLIEGLFSNPVAGDIAYEIGYGLLYAATFMLPIPFFRLFSAKRQTERMFLAWKLPRETVLYILAAIAVVTAASYANYYMVSIFDFSAFSEEMLWGQEVSANYQLVLMFFTTAIVPAFVEEFLFRGLVLTNLLPYGRTTAVFASAFLFGIMHQNPEQFFYATVAGLVLGYVYVKTRSIWPCVLTHFVNNFIAVLQTGFLERLSPAAGELAVGILQAGVMVLGILAGALLLLRQPDRRKMLLCDGCFEKDIPADPDYVAEEIPLRRRVRLFFNAPMIIFVVLCVIQMVSLILMATLLY